jgi:hypothetical protein
MGNVLDFQKRNITHASTEQLKEEWLLWSGTGEEWPDGAEFHYESIHAELNRRGEGRFCAV